jgi:short-subunit dehydrogenase/phosphohistidine swiveling domain-containing protein
MWDHKGIMELQNKNVVITGASMGIGEKMAEAFAAAGANVLVIARSADKLQAVAERIGGQSLTADLSTAEGVDGLVDRCLEAIGPIDVWINNAGIETSDAFVATDRNVVRTLARLNFEAPLMLTHDVVNHMLGRGQGHVVQLSSVAGAIPFPGLTAYAGSKAGLTSFTESLRLELADTPINLTVVAPGPVDTAMWDRLDTGDSYQATVLKRFRMLQSLPKIKPEKIAAATVAAVQKEKRFVRLPARFGIYHMLNNAPSRLVEIAMTGVKLPLPSTSSTTEISATDDWEPIWATDNAPSKDWPLYTRGNVGEVFPEVVLPLTWNLYGPRAEAGWRGAYRDMGLLMPDDFSNSEPMTILSVFGGYCYINASYVRVLGVRAPGGTVEAIDMQFFGESDAPGYRSKPGDKNLRSTARLAKTVFRLLGTTELPALLDDKAEAAAYVSRYPGDGASDDALLDYFESLAPLFEQLFQRHIDNTFSVALLSGALVDLLVKAGKEDVLVSILGGIGDVESAAPSTAMWKLAKSAATNPTVNAQFEAGVEGLIGRLRGDTDAASWVADFGSFLEEFGSRGPNEWDIGSDPWDFRPELALAAIGRMRGADESHDPARQTTRLTKERLAAIEDVRAALHRVDRFQFDKALKATTLYSQGRERSKTTIIHAIHGARLAQAQLASRIADRGGPPERWKTCLLSAAEFRQAVADPAAFMATIEERVPLHGTLSNLIPPFIVDGSVPSIDTWEARGAATETVKVGDVIQGIAGCPGIARGTARVVLDAADPRELGPGDVLIAPITDPSWTPLFLAADAVVVDVGATMSHAVIVSRELGIPCVVSAVGATTSIPDGATLEIDGNAGTVTVVALP